LFYRQQQKKPVKASTSYDASFDVSFAVDGKTNTRWSSIYNELEWIYVDLGSVTNITGVKIAWEAAYSVNYNIEISNDTKKWTILKTITGNSSLDNQITGLSGSGRYVRINCTKRATPYGHSIWELEVYGGATTKINPSRNPKINPKTNPKNNSNIKE